MSKIKLLGGLILWDVLETIVFFFSFAVLGFFVGFGKGIGSVGAGMFAGVVMFLAVLVIGTYLVLTLIEKVMEWALDIEEIYEDEIKKKKR